MELKVAHLMTIRQNRDASSVRRKFGQSIVMGTEGEDSRIARGELCHCDPCRRNSLETIHDVRSEHRIPTIGGSIHLHRPADLPRARLSQLRVERFSLLVEIRFLYGSLKRAGFRLRCHVLTLLMAR